MNQIQFVWFSIKSWLCGFSCNTEIFFSLKILPASVTSYNERTQSYNVISYNSEVGESVGRYLIIIFTIEMYLHILRLKIMIDRYWNKTPVRYLI